MLHRKTCHSVIGCVLGAGIALGACMSTEEKDALTLFRLQRRVALEATSGFLSAVSTGDSNVISRVATESLASVSIHRIDRDRLPYAAASKSFQPLRVELVGCRGTVAFEYVVQGETREGIAELVCNEDRWVVSKIRLLVER